MMNFLLSVIALLLSLICYRLFNNQSSSSNDAPNSTGTTPVQSAQSVRCGNPGVSGISENSKLSEQTEIPGDSTPSDPSVPTASTDSPSETDFPVLSIIRPALASLQCKILRDQDKGLIIFNFQTENFMLFYDRSFYITVYDRCWYDCPVDDVDKLSRVKRVVNETNHLYNVNLFYKIDKKEGLCEVGTSMRFICLQTEPFASDLAQVLYECFISRRWYLRRMDALELREGKMHITK